MDNRHAAVRKLAVDLIQARDPRKEIGLDAWGRLLESRNGLELASAALRKHFSARELTPEWFRDRLFVKNPGASSYIEKLLLELHPAEALGAGYFVSVIEVAQAKGTSRDWPGVETFAFNQLARFDVNALDRDILRRLFLRAFTSVFVPWIKEGRLKPQVLGLDFLKALAFHPDWQADLWVAELRRNGPAWARDLTFDEGLSEEVLGWLGDVRRFAPADLGFEWLLKLAARGEPALPQLRRGNDDQGFHARRLRTERARSRRGVCCRSGSG